MIGPLARVVKDTASAMAKAFSPATRVDSGSEGALNAPLPPSRLPLVMGAEDRYENSFGSSQKFATGDYHVKPSFYGTIYNPRLQKAEGRAQ